MTGPAGTRAPTASSPQRWAALDVLRGIVVLGLGPFHSALVFDTRDDYYVKNDGTTDLVSVGAALGVVWAMPLLFLVAGIGTWYALQRRTVREFAVRRLRRLLVPLITGVLLLCPLPVWLELKSQQGYDRGYLAFYPDFLRVRLEPADFPFVLEGAPPEELYEEGHLWFLVLLLAWTFLLLPLLVWLRDDGRHAIDRAASGVRVRPRSLLVVPALGLATVCAATPMEEPHAAWGRWAYLLFFLLGYLLAADPRFPAVARRQRWTAVLVGLTVFLLSGAAFATYGDVEQAFVAYDPHALLARLLFGAAGWLWLVAIVGMTVPPAEGRGHAPARHDHADSTGPGRLAAYVREATLPVYVLHQPVLVAVAFVVVQWPLPAAVKYVAIVCASFALIGTVYELAVRRWWVTRFLFGLPPRRHAGMAG
jgi:peptidoglycan/LPS O-acetylase OafA/YrhL